MTAKHNRIMPETDERVLCIEVDQRVTLEAYKKVLEPAFRTILAKQGEIRLLLHYSGSFPGWDIDAAAYDLGIMTEVGRLVKKVALIMPPEQVRQRWTTLRPLLGGELKFFETDEISSALQWVKS